MTVEIVCPSREAFGSDRSAVRLASLLSGLGHPTRLAVPRARPELGLARLAAAKRLEIEPAPVLVASSSGVVDPLSPLSRRSRADGVELTIYNSSAVIARAGDSSPRALILREWLQPRSVRHRMLVGVHRRRVRAVIAVSHAVARRWRACGGGGIPVEVSHNWLEDEWFEPLGDRERQGVLFVGRFNQWKGQELLADAFEAAFAGRRTKPSLTFLGAEPAPSPFHPAAEALRSRCEEQGWRLLRRTDHPREELARAALVVLPSLRPEPFGNVILEALACGARVIAFPGGGVDDLAPIFAGSLQVVERGRPSLSAALDRWWSEGGGEQDPGERGRVLTTLHERFSADAAAPRWGRLIDRLVDG